MNERTHTLAKDIADCLRWHYPPNQDGWNARITNSATQAELWIHVEEGRLPTDARVVISAGFSDLTNYAPYDARGKHRITCTIAKTPPQIVKDITRRIFPDYLRDLQIAKERYAAHIARMQSVQQTAQQFAAILNLPTPEVKDDERARFSMYDVKGIYGNIEVNSKDMDIALTDIPFDLAAMMLVPIGEYIRAHAKEDEHAD
jgi:hypothetical protein